MNHIDATLRAPVLSAIDSLQQQCRSIPKRGNFHELHAQIPEITIKNFSVGIELSIGPWQEPRSGSSLQNWQEIRYIELKVYSKDQNVSSSVWIANGSTEEITKALSNQNTFLQTIEKGFLNAMEHLERDLGLQPNS